LENLKCTGVGCESAELAGKVLEKLEKKEAPKGDAKDDGVTKAVKVIESLTKEDSK